MILLNRSRQDDRSTSVDLSRQRIDNKLQRNKRHQSVLEQQRLFQTTDYNNMAPRATAKWGDNQGSPKRFSIPNAYKNNQDNDLEDHYN